MIRTSYCFIIALTIIGLAASPARGELQQQSITEAMSGLAPRSSTAVFSGALPSANDNGTSAYSAAMEQTQVSGDGCWIIVPSPNADSGLSALYRVAVVSANDVWASGSNIKAQIPNPLIEHWDGKQWSIVPAPSVGTLGTRLQGIAAVSTNDVWMVGDSDDTAGGPNAGAKTLTEHWDGTKWSVVPSAVPTTATRSYLRGVTALSSNNVWAAGYYLVGTGAAFFPLIEHWDGTQWTIVSGPVSSNSVVNGLLHEIKGLTPNDIWAVGWAPLGVGIGAGMGAPPLAFHWDGTQWSSVPVPAAGSTLNLFTGVAPVASNDVWAVGWYATNGASSAARPLTMHWDGTQWAVVPNPGVDNDALYGVTAIAANDVWAVGGHGNISLVMHWDGIAWTIVPSPNPPATTQSYLWGVASVSSTDVWAVNYSSPAGGGNGTTLVEHYTIPCGMSSSVVSRKTHGTAGDFDIDLPLTGTRGVECRSGGPNSDYTMIFTFLNPVTNCGTASTGSVNSGPNPNQCTVNLTGVPNAQYLTVTLTGAADSTGATGNVSGTMGVLVGDTSADGVVNSADITQTRRQSGNVTDSSNFREDVTLDGVINSADITLVRRQSGTALP